MSTFTACYKLLYQPKEQAYHRAPLHMVSKCLRILRDVQSLRCVIPGGHGTNITASWTILPHSDLVNEYADIQGQDFLKGRKSEIDFWLREFAF
jgi:hypothetical protein